ncbi:MAG: ATP-binding protein [Hydrogenophaga sp.]|uniref:ATP-binding protein n=1 Tax=Hydrogenophaga sp. TaxID=1904254 RepID=UPI0027741EB4|nr:ATP-binding protein [Hydrogenophaga sp.]MDP2419192.1 ATP-binding protein [Hydrogenophaga sp.]MDZ4187013.1 ATP-binding protein [Hydrogenophaga sp.]
MLTMLNLAQWQRWQWVAALASLLVVTLSPLAWIQWQQFKLLKDVSTNQVDSIMWQAYQLERELSRLDSKLHVAMSKPEQIDPYDLNERYEVFLSRIDLLTQIPRRDLIDNTTAYADAIGSIEAFVVRADPLFADPAGLIQDRESLAAMESSVETLLPQVAELTREANRAVARFVDERNAQLQQQSVLVITLAGVQSVVLLVFVVVLVRHIRRQQKQYAQLQHLSRELSDARDQAEAANHGKSVFLANMSHEIRTPFQGLLGMLNLLDEPNLTPQQRDYLQTARDSALHLLGVLNDILDVSTMESGTLKLSESPINLRDVVQEVESLMRVAANNKGLELQVNAASDLPTWVMADATRLRQIMFNLINNAIKFTAKGSVIAEMSCAVNGPPGVVLTVRDTGMGMDRETVNNLFTRFFQADNSVRRRMGGTGLGLEISRNLARMMGGGIQVSSEPGVGSVFTVTLQLQTTTAPTTETLVPVNTGTTRRLKVLVAEDHAINQKYMGILLKKMGHAAVFCENGAEALECLAQQAFDVVLLDYHMPVLDGLATTEAIRQLDGPAATMPVILVTADVLNETRQRAQVMGVNEFVSKPLQTNDLQRALQRCGLLDEPSALVTANPALPVPSPIQSETVDVPVRCPEPTESETPAMDDMDVIDREAYADIVSMLTTETLAEMLDSLLAPPQGTLHALVRALETGDRSNIRFIAHNLKGAAMLMGFKAIAQTAATVEHGVQETQDPVPTALVAQLLVDLQSTQKALRQVGAPVSA